MKRRVAAFVRPVNKNTSVVGMNSTCESRSSLKLIQVSKKKIKSKGCSFSYVLDLLSFTEEKQPKENRLWGKEGQRGCWVLLMKSDIVFLSCYFYEKWTTTREDFWQGTEREVPRLPSWGRALSAAHTWTQGSAPAPSEHISTIPHLTKHIRHCFVSDNANGIINGDFSQLTAWCERGEWLYYSPVLCSDFLWLYYIGPYKIPYE